MKVTPTPTTWVMGRPARAQVTNAPPVSVSQGEFIKNAEGENPKIQKGKQKVLEAPGTRKTGLQSHGGAKKQRTAQRWAADLSGEITPPVQAQATAQEYPAWKVPV